MARIVVWIIAFLLTQPLQAQTWRKLERGEVMLPSAIEGGVCNSSIDKIGVSPDRILVFSCQAGVWKKFGTSMDFQQTVSSTGVYSITTKRTSLVMLEGWSNGTTDGWVAIAVDGTLCAQDRMFAVGGSAWASASCNRPVGPGEHTITFTATGALFYGSISVLGY